MIDDKADAGKVRQVLVKARDLLASGWTQGRWARDVNGKETESRHDAACSWCAVGAITRAGDTVSIELSPYCREGARQLLIAQLNADGTNYCGLSGWNDAATRTKEEVLDLFDRTIAGMKGAE